MKKKPHSDIINLVNTGYDFAAEKYASEIDSSRLELAIYKQFKQSIIDNNVT